MYTGGRAGLRLSRRLLLGHSGRNWEKKKYEPNYAFGFGIRDPLEFEWKSYDDCGINAQDVRN